MLQQSKVCSTASSWLQHSLIGLESHVTQVDLHTSCWQAAAYLSWLNWINGVNKVENRLPPTPWPLKIDQYTLFLGLQLENFPNLLNSILSLRLRTAPPYIMLICQPSHTTCQIVAKPTVTRSPHSSQVLSICVTGAIFMNSENGLLLKSGNQPVKPACVPLLTSFSSLYGSRLSLIAFPFYWYPYRMGQART